MMSAGVGQRIDWAAQDVRATFFATDSSSRVDDLFAIAFQERPETYTMTTTAGVVGSSAQATGSSSFGQLSLLRNPNRFDLLMQPPEPIFESPPDALYDDVRHPLITDAAGALTEIKEAASRLCFVLSGINRIALSLTLAYPAPTSAAANTALSSILPYGIMLNDESDFMLQLNNRNVEDKFRIDYNSFSRWAVSPFQRINIVSAIGATPQASAQVLQTYYLAQKSVDINSQPLAKRLLPDEIVALLDAFELRANLLMTIS